MRCEKCHSPRLIRFLDGFGQWRIFCRSCQESVLIAEFNEEKKIKKLWEFADYHDIRRPQLKISMH